MMLEGYPLTEPKERGTRFCRTSNECDPRWRAPSRRCTCQADIDIGASRGSARAL